MIKNNNKGFTLIELLVVVLIIGILAAMAMPQYFKAMERSRMTEAVTMLASIAQAQQRKYMQTNAFATKYTSLDVAPRGNGVKDGVFCTKGVPGKAGDCGEGNGFEITLGSKTGLNAGNAIAKRVGKGNLQYDYQLKRFYNGDGTLCTADNANGAELCADFCGLEVESDKAKKGYVCCSDGNTSAAGACATPTTGL